MYKSSEACKNKNIMVCKMCIARNLRNVTLVISNGEFGIWCFDEARIHNFGDGGDINWLFEGFPHNPLNAC